MKKAKLTIKKMTTLTYSTKYKNRDFYIDIVEFGVNEHEAWIYTSEEVIDWINKHGNMNIRY